MNYAQSGQTPEQFMTDKIPNHTTKDQELFDTADYQTVLKVVKELWDGGVILRGAGFCYSMADLTRILLAQKGIKSRMIECKVTVMSHEPPNLILIGHDGLVYRGNAIDPDLMDTHVVVITDTAIPMIVDTSIAHIRQDVPFIIERAVNTSSEILASLELGTSKWTYYCKESVAVPKIHQQNILERIKTDQEVKNSMKWLKVLIGVALVVSSLNFLRGGYDFYQVYIDDTNYWGPSHIRQLVDKVDELEDLVRKPQDQRK